jgi:hypothetical protein
MFGATVTGLLTAFPKELVAAIAGLALLGTIGSGLAAALKDEAHREAALITFLVTLSGVNLPGIGSAFWGRGGGRDGAVCATVRPDHESEFPMNILFVADPLESFKTYKDTTFSMMREAQRRGHRMAACEPRIWSGARAMWSSSHGAQHHAHRHRRRLVSRKQRASEGTARL